MSFLLFREKKLSEPLLRPSSKPSRISEGKAGRSPSRGPPAPSYLQPCDFTPPCPSRRPATNRLPAGPVGRRLGRRARAGIRSRSAPGRKAPPTRPRSPLSARPARAAGPWLPRQPHANRRGARRSRYRPRRAPSGQSAPRREQGRGFLSMRSHDPHEASRGPGSLAAMFGGVQNVPSWKGPARVIESNSCTGHPKSYTVCLSALF